MRPTFKLVRDFIIPNLERQTYGSHMKWEDKKRGCFKISRIHQNNERFSQDCIQVYKAWSLKKNLWVTSDSRKITKAKHRLISALRRNPEIETLKKESAYYRFRLIHYKSLGGYSPSSINSQNDIDSIFNDQEENEFPFESFPNELKYTLHPSKNNFKHLNRQETETDSILLEDATNVPAIDESPSKSIQDFQIEANQDELIMMPISSENISDNQYSGEESENVCSDKCCCVLLLDSNFLCNQTCIWHGNLP